MYDYTRSILRAPPPRFPLPADLAKESVVQPWLQQHRTWRSAMSRIRFIHASNQIPCSSNAVSGCL